MLVHLAVAEVEACSWMDEHLEAAAKMNPAVRFVRFDAGEGVPAYLDFVRRTPTLLLLQGGVLVASADEIFGAREPSRFIPRAASWLAARLEALGDTQDGASGSEVEDEITSYCGRKGCRAYPHEHVAWGNRPAA